MVCTRCGLIGTDVRPDWSPHTNKVAAGISAADAACTAAERMMPMEFFQGRLLGPEELDALRREIEGFDSIETIDHELRGIVERN
jgi:hypothetical protein